jgi:hypothetical protein
MLEFDIITHGLYRSDQLTIQYDPTARISIPSQTQAWMDEFWQEQLQQARLHNKLLFDAPLFRYVNAQPSNDQSLHLILGDTSYKEYVTTRTPLFAQGRPHHELANPLAVCSVIETSDGYILLDQRQGVDVYVGRYHVIGGFFERSLDTSPSLPLDASNPSNPTYPSLATYPSDYSTPSAQPDPFAAMRREIREETGIQSADICEQYCLGVVSDLTTPHAEMCFLTLLHIPLEEVQRRQPEDDEVNHLIPLHVTSESLRTFIFQHHGNISATGEPNLLFYGSWKFGTAWLTEITSQL